MVVQRVANPGFFDSIGRCFPRALSSKVQQAAKTGSLFLWVFITLWHALRPPPPPAREVPVAPHPTIFCMMRMPFYSNLLAWCIGKSWGRGGKIYLCVSNADEILLLLLTKQYCAVAYLMALNIYIFSCFHYSLLKIYVHGLRAWESEKKVYK